MVLFRYGCFYKGDVACPEGSPTTERSGAVCSSVRKRVPHAYRDDVGRSLRPDSTALFHHANTPCIGVSRPTKSLKSSGAKLQN